MSVCIIGTGNYAKAIGARISHAGTHVVYGSRKIAPLSSRTDSDAPHPPTNPFGSQTFGGPLVPYWAEAPPIMAPCDAVKDADIVIMAIPISGHADTAAAIREHLKPTAVVIDVSNTTFSRSEAQKHSDLMEAQVAALESSLAESRATYPQHGKHGKHHAAKLARKVKKERRKAEKEARNLERASSEKTSLLSSTVRFGNASTVTYMSINGDDTPLEVDSEPFLTEIDSAPGSASHSLFGALAVDAESDPTHKLTCKDPCCNPESEAIVKAGQHLKTSSSEVGGRSNGGLWPTMEGGGRRGSVSDIENLHKHPRIAKLPSQREQIAKERLSLLGNGDVDCERCEGDAELCRELEKAKCPKRSAWNRENAIHMSNAEHLQRLLPDVAVVKAFNTVSAYALQAGPGAVQEDRVLVCGDVQSAKEKVYHLVWSMGMRPVDAGPLMAARDTERKSVTLFEDWRAAGWISAALFVLASVYIFIRDILLSPYGFFPADLFLLKFNVIVAWHALALFTATFAAGTVAALKQLWSGTAKKAFPKPLEVWLNSRKALGLMALASAFTHMITAVITDHLFVDMGYVRSKQGTEYQASIFAALISLLLYLCLVATSIPSVGSNLSWREWTFVQSKLGIVGLAFAALHSSLMLFALGDLPSFKSWPHFLPPASLILTAFTIKVLLVRAFLAIPPISKRLDRIRAGA